MYLERNIDKELLNWKEEAARKPLLVRGARHTYATTLKRSGISSAVISEALGHSSEATTKAYLDKFEQTETDNTFKHLI